MENTKKPFAVQAGIISLWSPIVAICLNFFAREIMVSHEIRTLIGYFSILLIIGGFAFGIVGLFGIRKYGPKGILVRCILGIALNGFLIVSTYFLQSKVMKAKKEMYERMAKRMIVQPFTFNPPSYFIKLPKSQFEGASITILEAYIKGDQTDEIPDILLFVEELKGTIGKEDLSKFILDNKNIKILNEKWKGHQIQVFEVSEIRENNEYLTYNAQIPLIPKAIQIKVFGPAERKEELQKELKEILQCIEGSSNWE